MEKALDAGKINTDWLKENYLPSPPLDKGWNPPHWDGQRKKPDVAATMSIPDNDFALKTLEGEKFVDFNQGAREAHLKTDAKTDVYQEAVTFAKEEAESAGRQPDPPSKVINAIMSNSHAEISLMQRSKDSKAAVKDQTVVLSAAGHRAICKHCQYVIPSMAEKMEIRFLLVTDEYANKIYYWHPGIKELKSF